MFVDRWIFGYIFWRATELRAILQITKSWGVNFLTNPVYIKQLFSTRPPLYRYTLSKFIGIAVTNQSIWSKDKTKQTFSQQTFFLACKFNNSNLVATRPEQKITIYIPLSNYNKTQTQTQKRQTIVDEAVSYLSEAKQKQKRIVTPL